MKQKETPKGEIVLYKTPEGDTQIDVKLEEDTVWLTPNQMASLFNKARPTVLEHIKNTYIEGELPRESTCRKFRQVQKEGNRKIDRVIVLDKQRLNHIIFLPAIINSGFLLLLILL